MNVGCRLKIDTERRRVYMSGEDILFGMNMIVIICGGIIYGIVCVMVMRFVLNLNFDNKGGE